MGTDTDGRRPQLLLARARSQLSQQSYLITDAGSAHLPCLPPQLPTPPPSRAWQWSSSGPPALQLALLPSSSQQ